METEVVTEVTNEKKSESVISVYEIRTDLSTDIIVTHDFDEAIGIVWSVFGEGGGALVKMRCARMRMSDYERMEDA